MGAIRASLVIGTLLVPIVCSTPAQAAPDTPRGTSSVAMCHGQAATIVGTAGDDDLTGTAGPDVIAALGGNDTVHALAGDDLICGGTGGDTLAGGPGADRITGQRGNDDIDGDGGDDRITGAKGKNFLFAAKGDDVLFENHRSGLGRNAAWGGAGADVMRFATNDDLFGGRGPDLISSAMRSGVAIGIDDSHGRNTIVLRLRRTAHGLPWSHAELDLGSHFQAQLVLPHQEPLSFLAKVALLRLDVAHARSWTVRGTPGADAMVARRGSRGRIPVVMQGRGGNDVLVTGRGDDTLDGGPGHDRGHAGPGHDTCHSVEAPAPGYQTIGC